VVADRGMVSQATLQAFEQSDPPVGYVVGVRMQRQKEVSTSVFGSRARWWESVPERRNAKDPSPLKIKEVCVEDRRKDEHDREAIVAHLKEQLRRGGKRLVTKFAGIISKSRARVILPSMKSGSKPRRAMRCQRVLRTNTFYNAETVALVYKNLWTVEDIFRTTKSILETRPIYHKRDETVRGHVFRSFLALVSTPNRSWRGA
jgi:hypothetical protein